MSAVNLWTNRALTDEEQDEIEKRYGFEVLLDSDDFDEDLRRHANYMFGTDQYEPEENEDLFPREAAEKACEFLTTREAILRVSVTPYQSGARF